MFGMSIIYQTLLGLFVIAFFGLVALGFVVSILG